MLEDTTNKVPIENSFILCKIEKMQEQLSYLFGSATVKIL